MRACRERAVISSPWFYHFSAGKFCEVIKARTMIPILIWTNQGPEWCIDLFRTSSQGRGQILFLGARAFGFQRSSWRSRPEEAGAGERGPPSLGRCWSTPLRRRGSPPGFSFRSLDIMIMYHMGLCCLLAPHDYVSPKHDSCEPILLFSAESWSEWRWSLCLGQEVWCSYVLFVTVAAQGFST